MVVCVGNIACTNKNRTSYVHMADNMISEKDTVVVIKNVPEEVLGNSIKEVECFVTVNFTKYIPVVLITETGDGLIIRLNSFFGNYDENPNDTSIVGKKIDANNVKALASMKEKYDAIKLIIERVSKDFELSKTNAVLFNLSTFKEEAIQITEKYRALYGLEPENLNKEEMIDLIKKSTLFRDLNLLFNEYSIKLGKVYVENIMCVPFDMNEKNHCENKLPCVLNSSVIISTMRLSQK